MVAGIEQLREEPQDRDEGFVEDFAPWDDGHAAARVVQSVLAQSSASVRSRRWAGDSSPSPEVPMAGQAQLEVPDVVLLAAGRGSRLGSATAKPLTPLGADGETLLGRQLRLLAPLREAGCRTTLVVGHREEDFRATVEGVDFVCNARYAQTNTARSLLCALAPGGHGTLWLNTDVLFSYGFAEQLVEAVLRGDGGSFVAVRRGRTADEEVKYTVDGSGAISSLSKQVQDGLGEAVGANFVAARDRPALRHALTACQDDDYFEKAVEATISAGRRWTALDLTEHFAVEVDFPEDLAVARAFVAGEASPVLSTVGA